MYRADCLTYAPSDGTVSFMNSLPKQKAVRDPEYMAWIRTLPCAACGTFPPSDPHHQPAAGHSSTSLKCDDTRTVPLCRSCHDLYDTIGRESFWGDLDAVENLIVRLNIRFFFIAPSVAHISTPGGI